jgi:glycosyltransferase involved in cell wall biosynthesis
MKRRRVLVASEPMEYGVLSYLQRLFEGLDQTRWELALAFSPHRMAPQGQELVNRLAREGVRLCRLPFRRSIGLADGAAVAALFEETKAFRPDLIHLHSTKAGVIGRLVARMCGVPSLYTPHGTSWRYTGRTMGRVQLALERRMRDLTDLLVSVCREEAAAFVDEVGFAPERVRVVPNGVTVPDGDRLNATRHRMRSALGMMPAEVWGLFVGRLSHEKGADVLVSALESVTGLDGLLVVGDGPERSRLETEAARSRVPVRFCGYHEAVSDFLAAADVFVQPSRSEGLPFAALEAMAHGLPIVGSAVGGIPSAVDGCGRLVAADAPAELAACLGTVAGDAELRRDLGAAGRARVMRDFGAGAMLRALQEAYEETLSWRDVRCHA